MTFDMHRLSQSLSQVWQPVKKPFGYERNSFSARKDCLVTKKCSKSSTSVWYLLDIFKLCMSLSIFFNEVWLLFEGLAKAMLFCVRKLWRQTYIEPDTSQSDRTILSFWLSEPLSFILSNTLLFLALHTSTSEK